MWRKRREKCRFGTFRTNKRACGISPSSALSVRTQSQKNNGKVLVSPLGCDTGATQDVLRGANRLLKPFGSGSPSETFFASNLSPDSVTDTEVSGGSTTTPTVTASCQESAALAKPSEIPDPSKLPHSVTPLLFTQSDANRLVTGFKESRTVSPSQRLEVDGQPTHSDTDERTNSEYSATSPAYASLNVLKKDIHGFLDDFHRIYGSFIPLQKRDVLRHLKRRFNTDFSERFSKNLIFPEVTKYKTANTQRPFPSFRVVYKKHTLTLDDLSTLADQNWLNDQVMNMYGELIMESAHHQVHFLNSFFHRQLMTKGYDGVKRWTKQVDLFSKSLLLVPVHLEVHWCLVTADVVKKKICLYDSQGNALQKVARNILKYLMTEAKEKKQTAFESGWDMSYDEKIPQQTNENDCGVFVLEYSRCLALGKPLQFSQKDIPKIRKRIYKELCDCTLHEPG